ncbi:hypothetical protein LGH82_19125 [Mesorhizobium sp. PAMC28654]|uniref:hypothetical protein n=1 Tax=Mesorhizobium sp. PAMC28654 TaxID=2880934 RepID=UPI001D0AE0DB|nr:hypothetical protein [Mesorhizobium sp. PAMC28654]UDL87302.1 hypothetical protein LGH82_19125 [Mesorhizobium sp. PAMC28654]
MAEFRDVDWSEHYRFVGTFVVEFEKIPTKLRYFYSCILQLQGLKVWELGANVLSIVTISPESLAIAYGSALKLLTDDKNVKGLVDDICKRTKTLAERRNEIVHGEWRIGPEMVIVGTDKLPDRFGIKRKPTKDGQRVTDLPTINELSGLVDEARAIAQMIERAFIALVMILEPPDAASSQAES